jgi:hypothetical protein
MKATHTGTCQICGNSQKLPNGILSNHGYTVQMGWFSGICTGAKHLPFEKSCDLIQFAIDHTKGSIVTNKSYIEELKVQTEYVWLHVYVNTSQYTGKYIDVKVNKEDLDVEYYGENNERIKVTYKHPEARSKQDVGQYVYGASIEEKILEENKRQIRKLENLIEQMESYVAWQTERVANWKEQDLTEI